MTPAQRAAADQVLAEYRERAVAIMRLSIEAHDAAASFRDFGAAIQASDFRCALDEAEEVATHPDLAELNVAMDGWYA